MPETTIIAQLRAARVIPVVRTHTAAAATTAVQWLRDAGLRVFEITMTIPDAPALIRELAADPALLIGAGTVPDLRTAHLCLDAGARFIVAALGRRSRAGRTVPGRRRRADARRPHSHRGACRPARRR